MKRLTAYATDGTGVKLTPSSPSFKVEALTLKEKGIVEPREDRVCLTQKSKN
jgi:hypothetical protein